MLGLMTSFAHKAEIRESKDEIMVGEIVRAMARQGHPAVMFRADDDRQMLRFLTVTDPVLHSVFVILDRKTGTGAISSAILGSKATLRITAEIKNNLTDPDDIVSMYKTELANLFKLPAVGGVKLNHELNSVYATTQTIVEIDHFVMKGDEGVRKLTGMLSATIGRLREKLEPYKK